MYSRSAGQEGQVKAPDEAAPPALAASVTDAMRTSPVFTAYDFTLHLQPATAGLEVELRATVRNDGPLPLATLPLQLSSSLHFEHIRSGGRPLRFAVHRIDSDADHTGALTEAAVALPMPLAPGASLSLNIEYSGTIPPSSARLDRLGTPAPLAAKTDWDRISEEFIGLRGFGDTVWYPVTSVPALLGDGARLFEEIGRQKQVNGAALVSMHITLEWKDNLTNIAVLDGHPVAVGEPASLPSAGFPGVARVVLDPAPLGFAVPSVVLAARSEALTNELVSVAALPSHEEDTGRYRTAADLLEPLFADWLGARPRKPLLLLDLPEDEASPSDDGDALLLSLMDRPPSQLAGSLADALTHVYFHSPRPWLREGVAGLMSVLWTERTEGRSKAVEQLGAARGTLALAEPASPAAGGGQPLLTAQDAVFYRAKATSVLWMLRTLAGDAALGSTLRAYDPAKDTKPGYFETLLEEQMAAQPKSVAKAEDAAPTDVQTQPAEPNQFADAARPADTAQPRSAVQPAGTAPAAQSDQPVAGGPGSLAWFFKAWVYEDPGLPDLAITNVFPSRTSSSGDQWLVAVQLSNTGYAEAMVPLTLHSASGEETVQLRVPARGTLSRRILLPGEPTEVDLNDGTVPEVQASVHRRLLH